MTKQVNIRVPDDLKTEWDEFVGESNEYQNLSELIRHAVNAETRGVRDGGSGSAVDLEPLEDRLTEIEEAINSVQAVAERNHGILAELREQSRASEPDVAAVKSMLYDALPSFSVGEEADEAGFVHGRFADAERDGHGMLGHPQQLAAELGVPLGTVETALDELADETARVSSVEYGGGERFYVRE